MTDWNDLNQFFVFGHRGIPSQAPENTLLSFRRALESGEIGIELDVHCVEEQLVVIHDRKVNRTTEGRGFVDQYTLASLRQLNAGNGEKIPLLTEVLALLEPHHLINIELKGEGTGKLTGSYFRHNPSQTEQVLVSSFDFQELREFGEACPNVRVGMLSGDLTRTVIDRASSLSAFSVHLADRKIKNENIAMLRELGFRVLVYTVNDLDRAIELKRLGVTGIFTDDAPVVLSTQKVV
ncbi:MAG: glycerophosphodiester phosphodiesterase family protein [Gammaproteobacteria bacterium]|nr:glycerophosphodiester phosphodiesterase family protein [Gammaproteobacteria bacterium]